MANGRPVTGFLGGAEGRPGPGEIWVGSILGEALDKPDVLILPNSARICAREIRSSEKNFWGGRAVLGL